MKRSALIVAAVVLAYGKAIAAERPFDPLLFFAGRTTSSGTITDSFGSPVATFSGTTNGRRQADGSTVFDQDIRMSDGSVRRRSFRLVRSGPDSVDVTGSEVVGTARGMLTGDTLRLKSSIILSEGNPLSVVQFDQLFRAAADGRSIANHSDISALGFPIRRADEVFTRVRRR